MLSHQQTTVPVRQPVHRDNGNAPETTRTWPDHLSPERLTERALTLLRQSHTASRPRATEAEAHAIGPATTRINVLLLTNDNPGLIDMAVKEMVKRPGSYLSFASAAHQRLPVRMMQWSGRVRRSPQLDRSSRDTTYPYAEDRPGEGVLRFADTGSTDAKASRPSSGHLSRYARSLRIFIVGHGTDEMQNGHAVRRGIEGWPAKALGTAVVRHIIAPLSLSLNYPIHLNFIVCRLDDSALRDTNTQSYVTAFLGALRDLLPHTPLHASASPHTLATIEGSLEKWRLPDPFDALLRLHRRELGAAGLPNKGLWQSLPFSDGVRYRLVRHDRGRTRIRTQRPILTPCAALKAPAAAIGEGRVMPPLHSVVARMERIQLITNNAYTAKLDHAERMVLRQYNTDLRQVDEQFFQWLPCAGDARDTMRRFASTRNANIIDGTAVKELAQWADSPYGNALFDEIADLIAGPLCFPTASVTERDAYFAGAGWLIWDDSQPMSSSLIAGSEQLDAVPRPDRVAQAIVALAEHAWHEASARLHEVDTVYLRLLTARGAVNKRPLAGKTPSRQRASTCKALSGQRSRP